MRRHLTYANVMATVAVFVALGGTATAALTITGRDIKNGTITSADIKNRSLKGTDIRARTLRATHFRRGQLPRGATGATGAAGPAGAPGPAGPAGAAGADATTVGWARVLRERSDSPGNPGVPLGAWAAPASENLVAVAGSAAAPGVPADTTVCLQFATAPAGIVAMAATGGLTVRGGVDPAATRARCEAVLPGANAHVFATDGQGNASNAFDAFVSAF